ncbi:MAG TPA: beta-propeller fold lactonase family protein [Bryobacteraceae bacterium]|nr:beta-propeller fold lactonase family protein [Bryobacteraceae bacterium]
MKRALGVGALGVLAALLIWPQRENLTPRPDARVGPVEGGGFLLTTGWTVRPAGKQAALSTLPLAARLVDGGKSFLVVQSGYRTPTLSLHDSSTGAEQSKIELKDSLHGIAVRGNTIWVGGGTTGSVFELRLEARRLELARALPAGPERVPAHGVFIADVALSPDGKFLYAADISGDAIAVLDLKRGRLQQRIPTAAMPYRILFHPDGKQFLVTSWSGGEVVRHDSAGGSILQRVPLGSHPTDMVWQPSPQGLRLFVAAAHTNDVYLLSSQTGGELRIIERLSVAMTPRQPPGMTPSALALSPDGRFLYVACSDANAIAVADVSGAMSRVVGFIPAGWYPTETLPLPDGRLVVLNGKGLRSFPNPKGPQDNRKERPANRQQATYMQIGGMSLIDPVDEERLKEYTRAVYLNSPYRDQLLDNAGTPEGNPVPSRPGQPSPIRHVIYVVKENRTYDQVFGDLKEGNGDPSLLLFTEESSPNHRKLAREFNLFDNFYVNGDVSADGQNWSSGAIAPDYTNKLQPNVSSGRGAQMSLYWGRPPQNRTEEASRPHGGYLWTRAFEAGLSVRNYGWMTKQTEKGVTGEKQILDAESKQLMAATNPFFRGFDTTYPDQDRIGFFLSDLAEFQKKGEMPRLIVMRLGNDHTAGMRAGSITPVSMFADNDLALGRLVEAVSKSRFWKDTAIFVLEDDAQAGPDHVDSHRSLTFVISPYAKRRHVESNMYNTVSVLRTIELILGLRPMTHFDAGARPMYTVFTSRPDYTPYTAARPRVSLTERNPGGTELAARSARLDLSEADRIDDHEMNDILWRGIKGVPSPAPRRSIFYQGTTQGDGDGDDR